MKYLRVARAPGDAGNGGGAAHGGHGVVTGWGARARGVVLAPASGCLEKKKRRELQHGTEQPLRRRSGRGARRTRRRPLCRSGAQRTPRGPQGPRRRWQRRRPRGSGCTCRSGLQCAARTCIHRPVLPGDAPRALPARPRVACGEGPVRALAKHQAVRAAGGGRGWQWGLTVWGLTV